MSVMMNDDDGDNLSVGMYVSVRICVCIYGYNESKTFVEFDCCQQ